MTMLAGDHARVWQPCKSSKVTGSECGYGAELSV